ncbi:spore germination protein KA [Paenibacillus endophyticus]|uniref:Spore germination protein KA n=1 Tax=Paenibacillus endophyticus TaxID=1294268 RepID=A0A7W5CCY5_9BACL|nr:spore germination protein [Paenibacillus endophyticus]MBB3155317.1 spore germination protein KA [Paenibacillus endophyticus]
MNEIDHALPNDSYSSTIQSLGHLRAHLKLVFGNTDDLAVTAVRVGEQKGLLCYLETMTNVPFMMDNIVKPLSHFSVNDPNGSADALLEEMNEKYYGGLSGTYIRDLKEFTQKLAVGQAGLAVEGASFTLMLDVKQLDVRSVAEPTTQTVVRGPKDGFTESADTNMSLIRRRLVNEKLRFEKYTVGNQSQTSVYLAYIDGALDVELLRRIRARLQTSLTSSVLDSGNIEELLRPRELSLFPTVYNSERPDAVCAAIMEAKVAIIVNGSPFVLVVPAVMNDFFKSPEDHYQWFAFGTLTRVLRYLAFFFSLFVPSLYVAVTTFHAELVPTVLLISILAQREGIPFPAVIEILLMEITFEILREAGTRMPRVVGPAISIVGALVLGEAAVQAGIVSNINVIVVALTAISGFVAPIFTFGANVRLLRFGFIFLAAVLGFYGIILGSAFLLIHLVRLHSYGVSYLSPFIPFRIRAQKDGILIFQTPLPNDEGGGNGSHE